ncbi:PD-(D/E)XK nuclease family protein [Rhizobium sp. 814_E9_N1_1]|uniref:PD-(D/E)XK nuclease family protein n=1 Tax=unclassified Rhizobium TaxID=2613769 RepID=UPI003F2287B7
MRRLMSHLAQFSSLSKQGELLCTQGLAYLLQNPDARKSFGDHISKTVGRTISSDLTWRAEARQKDGARPDLEGCTADGKLVVKIEAKLGAAFGEGQLSSYHGDLQESSDSGTLLVLVPHYRVAAMKASVSSACALTEDSPWQLGLTSDFSVAVIDWEGVLVALRDVRSEPFLSDLAQFEAMYRVLNGYDIEPLRSVSELLAWREREEVFVNLVDRVTRRLQRNRVLPMSHEKEPNDYQRRYVCRLLGDEQPCFSLGVRDPFAGHKTPIWLRFHRLTPKFSVIRERLVASGLSQRITECGGHIWIHLDVPLNADGERLVESLLEQAQRVIEVAYQPL